MFFMHSFNKSIEAINHHVRHSIDVATSKHIKAVKASTFERRENESGFHKVGSKIVLNHNFKGLLSVSCFLLFLLDPS